MYEKRCCPGPLFSLFISWEWIPMRRRSLSQLKEIVISSSEGYQSIAILDWNPPNQGNDIRKVDNRIWNIVAEKNNTSYSHRIKK